MSKINSPTDHPWSFVLLLFFVFLATNLIGSYLASQIWRDVFNELKDGDVLLDAESRQGLRLGQIVFHLFTFTISAAIVALLAYGRSWLKELGLAGRIDIRAAGAAVLLMLLMLPVASVLQYLNVQISLSEAAAEQEALSNNILRNVLFGESSIEVFTLFTAVAILPAVGEELLFRGLIQGRILPMFIKDRNAQVILAGLLFSVLHMEMAGILPRWALGIAFGYALLWSKSLWVPIIMHLVFNGLQAYQVWSSGEFQADTEVVALPQVVWIAAAIALPASILLILRQSRSDKTSEA
ncbi:MAG: CPBP family intramembrane glutamic endopeptidase [Bacteroidota bacterium]